MKYIILLIILLIIMSIIEVASYIKQKRKDEAEIEEAMRQFFNDDEYREWLINGTYKTNKCWYRCSYYELLGYEKLTQQEIAEAVETNQSRINRKIKKIIEDIRRKCEENNWYSWHKECRLLKILFRKWFHICWKFK